MVKPKTKRVYKKSFEAKPGPIKSDILFRQVHEAHALSDACDAINTRLASLVSRRDISRVEVRRIARQVHQFRVLAERLLVRDKEIFSNENSGRFSNGKMKGYETIVHRILNKEVVMFEFLRSLVKRGVLTKEQAGEILNTSGVFNDID